MTHICGTIYISLVKCVCVGKVCMCGCPMLEIFRSINETSHSISVTVEGLEVFSFSYNFWRLPNVPVEFYRILLLKE